MISRRKLFQFTSAAMAAACMPVKVLPRVWEVDYDAMTCTELAASELIDYEAMAASMRVHYEREFLLS